MSDDQLQSLSPLIHFEEVRYQTSDQQFHLNINELTVSQGEKVAITGPSGSGKTTVLSLISGYKIPQSGTIKVLGHHLQTMNEKERETLRLQKIGMVFQDFRLVEYLTVRDNIALTTFLSSHDPGTAVDDRIKTIASQLNLESLLHRYPHQLSQGESQRVAIGRAIFPNPLLILADEPTGNLDPATAKKTLDFLFEVTKENSTTLIMVTHDHSLLPQFTRHIDMANLCREHATA